jgi:hypothetical protein
VARPVVRRSGLSKGFETALGGLASVDGIVTGAGEVAKGFVLARGNIDGRELARAPQAREWDGVTPVSVHALARLLGHEGGGDDVADLACWRERAREPGPAGSRVLNHDQVLDLSVQLAHELIDVAWPRAHRAEVEHLSAVGCGDRGHRDGLFMDRQSDVQGARLGHG